MTRLAALAALLLVLTGCGSADPKSDPEADPAAQPSAPESAANPASESPDSDAQTDLQAKIITNAPPKNLTWLTPRPPTNWRQLKTETGMAQWQVGQEPCTVTLNQPAGVGTGKEPSSEQVLDREIGLIAKAVKATGQPTVTKKPVMVGNQVVGLDGSTSTKFAHARVAFDNGVAGDVRTHRSGDFALIASAVCGKNRFDAVFTKDVAPFLDQLMAKTTY